MAVDMKAEMRRPMPRALAVIALVGWILAIWAFSSGASDRRTTEVQLSTTEAARQQLVDELAEHTKTVGLLNEVRQQLAAAAKERDTVSAQLDSSRRDAETAKTGLADLGAQVRQAADSLGALKHEQMIGEQSLGATKADLAKLNDDVLTRTAELADATKGLDAARQQESDTSAAVERLNREAATAQASATQARQAEAAAQKQLSETLEALAALVKGKVAAAADVNNGLQQQGRDPMDGREVAPQKPTYGDQPDTAH